MESSSDNFEYVFQLSKVLSSECRANRQESDKIESILRRLAKQTCVSYDQLSGKVPRKTQDSYDKISAPSLSDKLILDNYNLIYQIELEEYVNHKIWGLINEVIEHLNSIRGFVIDRKLTGYQDIDHYVEEVFDSKIKNLDESSDSLRTSKDITREKLDKMYNDVRTLLGQIEWGSVSKESKWYIRFNDIVSRLQTTYGVDLVPETL